MDLECSALALRPEEQALLDSIDLHPEGRPHDAGRTQENGRRIAELMRLLRLREAIPAHRWAVFADAALIPGRRRAAPLAEFRSRIQGDDAIYAHPHFLKHVRYFLYGPDLPSALQRQFSEAVEACGGVTSGDVLPLGDKARSLARTFGISKGRADEFFKLARECGVDPLSASFIEDRVKTMR